MELLKEPVSTIKGIGPKKTKALAKMDIHTLGDALYNFPRDYEIIPGVSCIASIQEGEMVSLLARFRGNPRFTKKSKNLTLLKWIAGDETGWVECIWFNQAYRANQYKEGIPYYIYGKATLGYGRIQIQNPLVEEYRPEIHDLCRIDPIYSLVEGLTQRDLRNLSQLTLEKIGGKMMDALPKIIRDRYDLGEKNYAIKNIHYPVDEKALKSSRRRLVFEELFFTQMALYAIRERLDRDGKGLKFRWDSGAVEFFFSGLPFSLTKAQERVIEEILGDLKKDTPMNRLVYGDVGSGKTLVAAVALYVAYLSGYQGVLMAPTEILARQHYKTLEDLLVGMGIRIGLLIGGINKKDKEDLKKLIAQGEIDIIIATHAVLQEDVEFKNLGIAITDEQHRFGVRQRAIIGQKGQEDPHMLVMSATPIPRTLALIFYGDLDISLIDELPPGRKPIKTYHVPSSMRARVYAFIRKQVHLGYQAYLVCPLIEESDKISVKSAMELFDELRDGPLSDLKLDLIHGRMKSEDKEAIMENFQKGQTQVLISTTVIEVGVNVAKANLMVIEDADRFGLAQLHQLRGRVGRSQSQAYCVLIADTKGNNAKERMDIMTQTNSGFEISQKDLELRGPGEFLGARQHGLPEFKIANIMGDMDILKEAQIAANEVMEMEGSEYRDALLNYAQDKLNQNMEEIALN